MFAQPLFIYFIKAVRRKKISENLPHPHSPPQKTTKTKQHINLLKVKHPRGMSNLCQFTYWTYLSPVCLSLLLLLWLLQLSDWWNFLKLYAT